MSDLLQILMQNMDQVAIQHIDEDRYQLIHPFNPWFGQFFPDAYKSRELSLRGASPFLDNFIEDAAAHWAKQDQAPLKSGPFLEEGRDGNVYPLEATAITVERDRLLILANLGESYQDTLRIMQAARENLLTQESLATEVSKRTQEIRSREGEIAMRLIHAAGFRDEETGAHIRRIGLYAGAMAAALGWEQFDIDDIRIAAPMHDIGKIAIPDTILRKPARLTADEFERMKEHTVLGSQILGDSEIPMVRMAADIAIGHHEFWNGSGYPHGRKGDEIPESARIVAIVDVYDALVHKRVYKEAIPEDEAIGMMRELVGKQFDPTIFEVFVSELDAMRRIRSEVPDEGQG